MAIKIKKSVACSFGENDPTVMQAAKDVLSDLEALSNEARYMMEDNPESKGAINLWNDLVDIEETVTDLSEGSVIPDEMLVTLGDLCIEATQLFNRSEEVSLEDAKGVFGKLNGVVFFNEYFA